VLLLQFAKHDEKSFLRYFEFPQDKPIKKHNFIFQKKSNNYILLNLYKIYNMQL